MAATAAYVVGQKRFVSTMRKAGADMKELKEVNRQAANIALPAVRNLAPRGKNGRGEKAEHAPRAEKSAKSAKEEPRFSEVDDSIQLIARRAPAQKYASFEEYMKAHEE